MKKPNAAQRFRVYRNCIGFVSGVLSGVVGFGGVWGGGGGFVGFCGVLFLAFSEMGFVGFGGGGRFGAFGRVWGVWEGVCGGGAGLWGRLGFWAGFGGLKRRPLFRVFLGALQAMLFV